MYNFNDNIVSRLQVTHSFYKHFVKQEVIKMRDILSRAQKYIQIEDVTRSVVDRSSRGEGEKPKP